MQNSLMKVNSGRGHVLCRREFCGAAALFEQGHSIEPLPGTGTAMFFCA